MSDSIRPRLVLIELPGTFAICKLDPAAAVPVWATTGEFSSITRTRDELSVVCLDSSVPQHVACERSWRGVRVAGAMPFTVVGILASLVSPLADAGISVFALSTFDTDYLLVKDNDFGRASAVLEEAGHRIARAQKDTNHG